MRDFSRGDLSHTCRSTRRRCASSWRCPAIIEACAQRGIRAIGPWRDQVPPPASHAIGQAGQGRRHRRSPAIAAAASSPPPTPRACSAALEDNRRAIDEAKTLGAPCLVLVVGALPGALPGKPAHKDIGLARAQVVDGIAATLDYARQVGMPLAIEPLHPMQAADRACINTLEQALDICDALDPGRTGALGVALDVYHVWWDPKLEAQIARAGTRAPARLPRLRLAGADARPAQRPRHDGRRHHRAEEDPRLGRGRRLRRLRRGRDLLRPLVGQPADEVLDTCIARYRKLA